MDHVRMEFSKTKVQLQKAREMGAEKCAPHEFAQAKGAIKLTEYHIEESFPATAEQHKNNADRWVRLAIETCESKRPPPQPAAKPASTNVAANKRPQPSKVESPSGILVVFDINDASASFNKSVLNQLTEYLATQLTSKGYQVVPRDQIRQRLLEEARGTYKECYDQSCQIELGRALAAQMSLDTKLLKIGEKCVINITLYDLKQQTTNGAAQAKIGCSENELMGGIDEVSRQLAGF